MSARIMVACTRPRRLDEARGRSPLRSFLSGLLPAVLAACAADNWATELGGENAKNCVPNQTQACTCGLDSGSQMCRPDHTLTECVCPAKKSLETKPIAERDARAPEPRPDDPGVVEPSPPKRGDILITEVLYDPAGTEPSGEWFEVLNTTSSARRLSGLTIHDGAGRTHVIGNGVVVGPGDFAVLVRSRVAAASAQVPSSAIVYEYGASLVDSLGVQLANSASGSVSLRDGAMIIAKADYGGWFPAPAGASIQLAALTFAAGSDAASWCVSTQTWVGAAEKGTPGASNDCLP